MISNLYHCTVHKAASTWFRDLFRDPIMKRAHGMPVFHYETDLKGRVYENYCDQTKVVVPGNSIITNVYCSHDQFAAHRKHENYKGFYVAKDPREVVISTYWSWRDNHPGGHQNREFLRNNDLETGLRWTIDELDVTLGKFQAMRTWVNQPEPNFVYFKTEDFFTNQDDNLRTLLSFLQINMPESDLEILCDRFSFEKLSGGRKPGQVDKNNHFRSGKTGTWREMPESVLDYFYDRTGDLIDLLEYDR